LLGGHNHSLVYGIIAVAGLLLVFYLVAAHSRMNEEPEQSTIVETSYRLSGLSGMTPVPQREKLRQLVHSVEGVESVVVRHKLKVLWLRHTPHIDMEAIKRAITEAGFDITSGQPKEPKAVAPN
jgi:hypothetical protein